MEQHIRAILSGIAQDHISDENLKNTPKRAVKALQSLTDGYGKTLSGVVGSAVFDAPHQGWVIVKNIAIHSLCEHHLLPFIGRCHIGYLPQDHILGVSKLARIADLYAHRLQLQERLTQQIAQGIMQAVKPQGVGVIIEAQHTCMVARGVEQSEARMMTSHMLGSTEQDSVRLELLQLLLQTYGDKAFN